MFHCNLCGTAAHVRSSRYLSENTKERYHQCQNINCGHTFVAMETIERSIMSPGTIIPVLPHPNNYGQKSMLMWVKRPGSPGIFRSVVNAWTRYEINPFISK